MSERIEPKNLLTDTLSESASADFRAALLDETLRHARSRRRWRQARQAAGVFVIGLLVGVLMWSHPDKPVSRTNSTVATIAPESFRLIETLPLPPDAVVLTPPFANLKMISTSAGVTEIATVSGGFRIINDAQLLAFASGVPMILIRTGPDSEELVFANPEDRKRLFGN